MNCRNCSQHLQHIFVDLGYAPPSNAYIEPELADRPEATFPLQVYVCEHCWLVQTKDYVQAEELFSATYAYFSSISSGWLKHAREYAEMIIKRQNLGKDSLVIEIASNDGYLLKNFVAVDIPCLGIEPTTETAHAAMALNIPVLSEFFTSQLASKLVANNQQADLVIGNNVLAHVPDIKDFVCGLQRVLKPSGIVTMEFPHLLQLLQNDQFDTIYHEHFSYLSLDVVRQIFNQAGLEIINVEELPTHGGSLRIYACHLNPEHSPNDDIKRILQAEIDYGLQQIEIYLGFQQRVERIKGELLSFLKEQKKLGKSVVGYGAAAKGNTLLNYASIKPDMLPVICDAAPSKQGKLMPGSHIPIYSPDYLIQNCPDYLLILPWNIAQEVKEQNVQLELLGTKFVTAVPRLNIS
jgi:SAM-dependent methyltransferase